MLCSVAKLHPHPHYQPSCFNSNFLCEMLGWSMSLLPGSVAKKMPLEIWKWLSLFSLLSHLLKLLRAWGLQEKHLGEFMVIRNYVERNFWHRTGWSCVFQSHISCRAGLRMWQAWRMPYVHCQRGLPACHRWELALGCLPLGGRGWAMGRGDSAPLSGGTDPQEDVATWYCKCHFLRS